MADYTPVYLPGHVVTFIAASGVTGGQVVALGTGGSMQVAAAGADSAKVIGVANHDAAAGQRVAVTVNAVIHETLSTGTIAAGDALASDVGGTVKTQGAAVNKIGLALAAATGGAAVRWIEKR